MTVGDENNFIIIDPLPGDQSVFSCYEIYVCYMDRRN